jgi:hypothetical protein
MLLAAAAKDQGQALGPLSQMAGAARMQIAGPCCRCRRYKSRLAGIDCSHFSFGERSCPFGTSCFYRCVCVWWWGGGGG